MPKQLILSFLVVFLATICRSQEVVPSTDSMLLELPKAKEDTGKVVLLVELGTNVSYYDPPKALEYANEARTLAAKLGYRFGLARSFYLCGNIHLYLGNYDSSKAMTDAAEEIFESLQMKDRLAMIYNARGNWYYMQSDLWNASNFFTKSAGVFHELKDTTREIIAYGNMIAVQGEVKNYDKAISLARRLLEIVTARNDQRQIGYTRHRLMFNFMALEKIDSAAKFVAPLLAYIANTTDHNLAADSYHLIGDYYGKKNNYDSALLLYKKALVNALRGNYQLGSYNYAIGTAYLDTKQLDSAYFYLNKAAALTLESNTMDVYYRICRELGRYYQYRGDYKQAYHYLQEYSKLNDSIIVEDTRRYSTQLEAMYENNKKEAQIIDLKNAELEKNIALRNRNNYLYIAGLVLLLIGGAFYIRTKNYRNKEKLLQQEKILQREQIKFLETQQQVVSLQSMINGQETERTRIAKDLHDGLGGLFSTVKMYFSSLLHEQQELKHSEVFNKSYSLIDTASEEVRRIAHNMMPEVLVKLGLVQAVQDLCANISAAKMLQVKMQAYGMDKRLSTSTEIMLYRIIQELLNNIIKHSEATEAILQFNKDGQRLMVTVEDNGHGFGIQDPDGQQHTGLDTIRNRVQYLNGNITIESHRETGTTVMMEFLLNEAIS